MKVGMVTGCVIAVYGLDHSFKLTVLLSHSIEFSMLVGISSFVQSTREHGSC